MDKIWSMWLSGQRVRLLCGFCATRNVFPNGKCENCGAKAQAPREPERYAVWYDNSYFAAGTSYTPSKW
jgi:hypothetical protein